MRLDSKILERGMKLAESAKYMGIPLTDMTRDELLAVAAEGWHAYSSQLEQSIASIKLLRDLRGME